MRVIGRAFQRARRLYSHRVPARTVLRFWLPPLLWTGVILAASTDYLSAANSGPWLADLVRVLVGHPLPAAQFGELHFLIRKAGHVTEYAILSALLFRALRGEGPLRWSGRWATAAIALAAAVGAFDEWHQMFVPSRTASPWDVLIDSGGAALAQIIIRVVLFFCP